MSQNHLLFITVVFTAVLLITPIAVAQLDLDGSTDIENSSERELLLPVKMQALGLSSDRIHRAQPQDADTEQSGTETDNGPSFIGAPMDRSGDTFLSFERVPPSDKDREERGFDVYRLTGSDRVRFEAYMGEQPTTGYSVHVANVTQDDDRVTVHVIFKQPNPSTAVAPTATYPSDAVEFDLPDGDYTVHVQTMAFQHDVENVSFSE